VQKVVETDAEIAILDVVPDHFRKSAGRDASLIAPLAPLGSRIRQLDLIQYLQHELIVS
jgi:hypothetical protein